MKQNRINKRVLLALTAAALCTTQALADGLPGEYFVTQRWRDLLAPYSPATNPALMTEQNYVTVRGAFSPSLGNSFVLYEGGATVPLGLYQSVGLSILGVTANDPIQPAHWDPETKTIVNNGSPFNDSHFRAMMSYAINPWNKLSLGGNFNIYYDPNFGEKILGFALDLGATYRIMNHPILGEHLVSLSFMNAISPDFKFEELQQQSINTKLSWMGKMWDRKIDAGIDLDFKDFTAAAENFATTATETDANGNAVSFVKEAAKAFEFDFNFRIGYWLMRLVNLNAHLGTGYWGLSGGMNVPSVFGGKDFQVAYQYMDMTADDLAFTHTIYFRGEFGPHREQIYAKKMAKQAILGPGNLYNQARQLFADKNYWDAFFLFGKIATEYPDFFKNDWVKYFMGACQEEMDMRELANESFTGMIDEYSKSPAIYHSYLGLMRVNYRDGTHEVVQENYNTIASSAADDSVKQAAAYYMGASRMAQNNYGDAMRYFSMVPATHADYPFAQHSMAVAYAMKDNYDGMLEHLDAAVQFVPTTEDQKEIINRSYVLMGFLYYEGLPSSGQSMVKAVAALQSVPSSSFYYEDALLGRSWIALKSNNWKDVRSAANELKSKTSNVEIKAEADLMLAYADMVLNTPEGWKSAANILTEALTSMKTYRVPTVAEVSTKQSEYYDDRNSYFELSQKVNELAIVNQSSYVLEQADSLKLLQIEQEKKIRSFGKFKDAHDRATFFGRNAENVVADLEYALPKAQERLGTGSNTKAIEKVEKADSEIERLQRELEELNK